ncbi:MAG: YicC family protein [Planctomycetes bacterium]|nr:YicC family protein [Planctomycetota bacterium]
MLFSMTGFGEARRENEAVALAVEVRSVNNRYFKFNVKSPDVYAALESDMEKTVRQFVSRGTVSVTLKVSPTAACDRYSLDHEVLRRYWSQLHALAESIHVPGPPDLGGLLQLPGAICEESYGGAEPETDWPLIKDALIEALEKLQTFRRAEGSSMQDELAGQCAIIGRQLSEVETLVPEVVREYRDRLLGRVRELLEGMDVEIQAADVIREISVFSERCDVHEEITRLQCHLNQFDTFLHQQGAMGRKLDFLGQEMFREINTIGSKANNVSIAHGVVEMKAAVEKVREILQNVE